MFMDLTVVSTPGFVLRWVCIAEMNVGTVFWIVDVATSTRGFVQPLKGQADDVNAMVMRHFVREDEHHRVSCIVKAFGSQHSAKERKCVWIGDRQLIP